MSYVDGFVIAIPKKNLAAYKKLASKAGKIWMEFGALQYVECMGDDLKTPMGTPFTKLAKTKPTETVVFSYIVYKSKADRDRINKKIMSDKRMNDMCGKDGKMPFEMKRMSYGGFKAIVEY